jgi:integrase
MTVYSKQAKNKKRWYYQFQKHGTIYRGGGYPTKREVLDGEIEERRLSNVPPQPLDFGSLCEKYLTYIRDRQQSARWRHDKALVIKAQFNEWYRLPIDSITSNLIEQHLIDRSKRAGNFAANRDLKILKAIMSFATKPGNEWIPKNPCSELEKLPEDKIVKRLPPLEHFQKIHAIANPIERKLLDLLFTTSARINEILDLRVRDDLGDCIVLRTRKHKGGAIREDRIRLTGIGREALDWLKDKVLNTEPDSYIFTNPRTLTRFQRMPKRMRKLCRKANVPYFGFHQIRALSASIMADANVSLPEIQSRLRHARATTTDWYLKAIGHDKPISQVVLDQALNFNDNSMKNQKFNGNEGENRENVQNGATSNTTKAIENTGKIDKRA